MRIKVAEIKDLTGEKTNKKDDHIGSEKRETKLKDELVDEIWVYNVGLMSTII